MRSQPQVENVAFAIGTLVGGAFVGLLCGLAPLLAGQSKNQSQLGWIGFASCVISGLLLGLLLAVPVALVFTLVILLKKPAVPLG